MIVNRSRILSLILLTGVFLIFALVYGRVVIQNDGISYYALTISLLHDGDFDLTNQSQKFPEVRFVNGSSEMRASQYSCGFAVVYAPFVFAVEEATRLLSGLATWRPYAQNARFPISQSLGIFTGSAVFGLLTVLAGISLLRRTYNVSWMRATVLSIAVLVGGSLMFYNFTCPSFAHAADAFLVALAFLLVVIPSSLSTGVVRVRNVLLGFVLGLSLLLRNNNIVLVPLLVTGHLILLRKKGVHRTTENCIEIFLGALPVLLVHVYYNLEQYGRLFATGYGMKKSLTLWIRLRNLGYLLVHPIAGLFVNNPIAIIALVGLFIGIRQRRSEAVLAMACIVTVLLSLSYVGYIYPGRAFGQRLLVHLYIFLLIGIYIFIRSFPVSGIILTTAFVIWSFILMNLYFVSTSQKEVRLPEVRGFNPIVMIEAAAQARKSSGLSLPKLWYRSISTGPYPTLHVILLRTQQPEIQNTDPGL